MGSLSETWLGSDLLSLLPVISLSTLSLCSLSLCCLWACSVSLRGSEREWIAGKVGVKVTVVLEIMNVFVCVCVLSYRACRSPLAPIKRQVEVLGTPDQRVRLTSQCL